MFRYKFLYNWGVGETLFLNDPPRFISPEMHSPPGRARVEVMTMPLRTMNEEVGMVAECFHNYLILMGFRGELYESLTISGAASRSVGQNLGGLVWSTSVSGHAFSTRNKRVLRVTQAVKACAQYTLTKCAAWDWNTLRFGRGPGLSLPIVALYCSPLRHRSEEARRGLFVLAPILL